MYCTCMHTHKQTHMCTIVIQLHDSQTALFTPAWAVVHAYQIAIEAFIEHAKLSWCLKIVALSCYFSYNNTGPKLRFPTCSVSKM